MEKMAGSEERSLHCLTPEEITDVTAVGYAGTLGLRFTEVGADLVRAQWLVTPRIHQVYGAVHGGAYCAAVESLASVGAAAWLGPRGRAVGVSNTTDFLRTVHEGILQGLATPIHRGNSQQLWQVVITDEQNRLVSRGRVRLHNISDHTS